MPGAGQMKSDTRLSKMIVAAPDRTARLYPSLPRPCPDLIDPAGDATAISSARLRQIPIRAWACGVPRPRN
jgi:hypothetical protein